MGNIFIHDNLIKYRSPDYSSNTGAAEFVYHDNCWAMDIEPRPFYNSSISSGMPLLKDEFMPNTRYVLDMWVDRDSTIYQDVNRAAGLTVRYTDGTSDSTFVKTGDLTNHLGYVHSTLITPATKSVECLYSYYWTSMPVYYRIDSFICPLDEIDLCKNGVLNGQNYIESLDNATRNNGLQMLHGSIIANDFIEL